jgi:hypothetical protein
MADDGPRYRMANGEHGGRFASTRVHVHAERRDLCCREVPGGDLVPDGLDLRIGAEERREVKPRAMAVRHEDPLEAVLRDGRLWRAPSLGNVCLGVWKQTAPRTRG